MNNDNIGKIYDYWIASQRSQATSTTYQHGVDYFCSQLFNKTVSELSEDDLNSLNPKMVWEGFVLPLREQGAKDTTISSYLTSVALLFKELKIAKVYDEVNYDYATKCVSTARLQKDGEKTKAMTRHDLDEYIDWVGNYSFKKHTDAMVKQYQILPDLMFRTAVRVSAAISICWTDFEFETDASGNTSWVLVVKDKGSKINKKPLSLDYYQRLHDLLYQVGVNELFPDVVQRQFNSLMKKFSDERGKTLSPHSLKVGAATTLYETTRDIYLVNRFCDHDDVNTTLGYIRDNGLFADSGSFVMSKDETKSDLNHLTKEELLAVIQSSKSLSFQASSRAETLGFI